MFCYQCEQTFRGTGCVDTGVCGKDPVTADLQDDLVARAKAVAQYAQRARQLGATTPEADVYVLEALFASGTNVNFDPARLEQLKRQGDAVLARTQTLAGASGGSLPAAYSARLGALGADVAGLQELVLYGLKGTAAYAEHARQLGRQRDDVFATLHEILAFLAQPEPTADALLGYALKTGELNLRVMEMLDEANTGSFGHPVPARVRVEPRKGKAIVVSGHDLADMAALLEQTAGKGINVYTHGELLPAHGYPELKKYPHLAGNFGGAWMNQGVEFDKFPGAILMTSNCIQKPRASYRDRLFTCGPVAWPGVTHCKGRDFTPVIEAALAAPGFTEDGGDQEITVGFGRNAVMGVAGKVIEAVKAGEIKHFYLIGGCDGARPGRNYYKEFATSAPQDSIIMTLACGKYRFNKLDFGTVAGLPRLLDIGQCNDAYSAIQIAVALAGAFDCGVNDLPLSFVISWYEQKAVAVLLTLLHLGIRNIRIGPSLPAFVTPAVLQILVDNYNLMPIGTAADDLVAIAS